MYHACVTFFSIGLLEKEKASVPDSQVPNFGPRKSSQGITVADDSLQSPRDRSSGNGGGGGGCCG